MRKMCCLVISVNVQFLLLDCCQNLSFLTWRSIACLINVNSSCLPCVGPGSHEGPVPFPDQRLYEATKPGFIFCCSIFMLQINVCFCHVRFSFFSTNLGRTSLRWPILCRSGRKTLTQMNCLFMWHMLLV